MEVVAPEQISAIRMKNSSYAVWQAIYDHISETGDRQVGKKEISRRSGVSETTIKGAILELRALQVLQTEIVKVGFDGNSPNMYWLFNSDGEEVLPDEPVALRPVATDDPVPT